MVVKIVVASAVAAKVVVKLVRGDLGRWVLDGSGGGGGFRGEEEVVVVVVEQERILAGEKMVAMDGFLFSLNLWILL